MKKAVLGLEDSIESGKQWPDLRRGCICVYEIFKIIVVLSSKWIEPYQYFWNSCGKFR